MRLLFLMLAISLFSCQRSPEEESPPREQTLRLNLHSEPNSLDPGLCRDIPSRTTGKMLFEGLMRFNLQGEIEYALAQEVRCSPDKTHWSFTLRDTVWSNGMPVTAFDFETAWKRLLSPSFPAESAHYLFILKNGRAAKLGEVPLQTVGVSARDSRTLDVELEHADPYFLQLVASPFSFPIPSRSEGENPSWASEQGATFICNGPFRLIRWEHGSELRAEKNPLYWDAPAVHLDTITLTMIADEHTELNMYENDELDWAGSPNSSLPPEALPHLKEQKGAQELFIAPLAGTYCFKFNTQAPPFNSPTLRRAFAFAINRNSLVDNILQANQLIAHSLLPPCMRPGTPSPLFTDAQRDEALALFEQGLEEMGWTRETLPPITLIFSRSEKHQKTAQAIQQQWNQTFGIKVALQSYEWNIFLDRLAKRDYQVGGRGWIYDIADPMALLEIYKFTNDSPLGGGNDTYWENPRFIELLDAAKQTAHLETRTHLLAEAEDILLHDMPIAPLYHSTACYLKKPYVHDVYMSELCDLDFKHTYIR